MKFLANNFRYILGFWCLVVFVIGMFKVLSFEDAVLSLLLTISALILNTSFNKGEE